MAEAASRGRNCSACAPWMRSPEGDASGAGAMPAVEHPQRRERRAGGRRDGSLGAGPLAGGVGAPRPGLLAFWLQVLRAPASRCRRRARPRTAELPF